MSIINSCPCCNGESELRSRCSWIATDGYMYYIKCKECDTMSGYYETEEDAIEAWNKRIPIDNLNWEYNIRGMKLPITKRFCVADCIMKVGE